MNHNRNKGWGLCLCLGERKDHHTVPTVFLTTSLTAHSCDAFSCVRLSMKSLCAVCCVILTTNLPRKPKYSK